MVLHMLSWARAFYLGTTASGSYMQHCIEMYTEHGYGADRVADLCTVSDWYRFRFETSNEEACL